MRRAERSIATLAAAESVNPLALIDANRLFVLAHRLDEDGAADVPWASGANR